MTINDNLDSFNLSNILNIRYLYSLSQLHIVIMYLPKTLVFTPSEEAFYFVCRDKPSKKTRKTL